MKIDPVSVGIGLLWCAWTSTLEPALLPLYDFPIPRDTQSEPTPSVVSEPVLDPLPEPSHSADVGQAFLPHKDFASPKVVRKHRMIAPRAQARNVVARTVVRADPPQSPLPAHPAPAAPPALPFVYFGRLEAGDEIHVFLRQGERNFSVKPGDEIDGVYRVERIDANNIVFAHLPSQSQQVLSVSGAPALTAAPTPAPAESPQVLTLNEPVSLTARSNSSGPSSVPGL